MSEAPKHSLFVSHVTEDRVAAMEIVELLERRGIKCWITPRDVRPGRFDDQISDAIDHCRALLLIFSDRCNESDYIYREVTVAGEAKKPILPLRIEESIPRRGLRMRLMDIHWIDAFAARQEAIDTIVRTIGADGEIRGEEIDGPDTATLESAIATSAAEPDPEARGPSEEPKPEPEPELAPEEAAQEPAPAPEMAGGNAATATVDQHPAATEANPPPAGVRVSSDAPPGSKEDQGHGAAAMVVPSSATRPPPAQSSGRQLDLGFILSVTEGRSTRTQWWIGFGVLAVMTTLLALIIIWAYGSTPTSLILTLAVQLFLIFPAYALFAKRFQDRDKPGGLALIGIGLGIVQTLTRLLGLSNPMAPTAVDWILNILLLIVGIWYLIELGCLRGTVGQNRYGPDPLEGR